jgi:hypothetical protein
MKVLEGAQRTPVEQQDYFHEHLKKLKKQLSEIEQSVEIDKAMASKYPGSTGNGDAKISNAGDTVEGRIFKGTSADMPSSLMMYKSQNTS